MKTFKLQAHEKPINVLKLNLDGDLLFSGSSDKRINLWYSLTGERIGQYTCKGANRALDVTKDSQYLVAGSLDGVIEWFQVDGGEQLGLMRRKAKTKMIEFSYGDKYLLILFESMRDATFDIRIYETEKLFETLKKTKDSTDELNEETVEVYKNISLNDVKVTCVKWGQLNKSLYLSTMGGEMIQMDLDGNILQRSKVHDNEIRSFAVAKDYSLLLTASTDSGKIIDPANFNVLRTFKQEVPMNAAAFSPLICDKKNPKYHCLLAGGVNARDAARTKEGGFDVHIYNIMYEKEVGYVSGHFSTVNQLLFHKDGRGYISAGEEGIIRMHRFDNSYFEDSAFE